MVTYEYVVDTEKIISKSKCGDAHYHYAALKLGATLVKGMLREGNISSLKLGPGYLGIGYDQKISIDSNVTRLLYQMDNMPSATMTLYLGEEEPILIKAHVRNQNAPGDLEARVLVVGDEGVLKQFETLTIRHPKIIKTTE